MPANLPPECLEAEKRYRAAQSTDEKIACLEDFLATIPKHKGTDKLRADYRRRLSQLKASSQKSKKAGRHESAFHIEKEGAGRAVLVGLPNVGKSALVAALTHATPHVSESPYTTWIPTAGMMPVGDVQIQLIDTPPLDKDHVEPELLDLIRSADLVLLVVDLQGQSDSAARRYGCHTTSTPNFTSPPEESECCTATRGAFAISRGGQQNR